MSTLSVGTDVVAGAAVTTLAAALLWPETGTAPAATADEVLLFTVPNPDSPFHDHAASGQELRLSDDAGIGHLVQP